MVRAATTGGFDYRGADPYNKQWRLKHALILQDVHRLAEAQICQAAHDHWLAYASHSNLESDSWNKVKKHATKALNTLQAAMLPWRPESEKEEPEDTINGKYGDLIRQYKEMVARRAAEKETQKNAENAQNNGTADQGK